MIGTKGQQDTEAVIFEDSRLLNCLQKVIQSKSENLAQKIYHVQKFPLINAARIRLIDLLLFWS